MTARAVFVATTLVVLAACSTPAGSPYPLPEGPDARRWGDGAYGLLVLAGADAGPSAWDAQARAFADEGMTVVVLAAADASAAGDAILALRADGVARVAVLAAGEGTSAALELGAQRPELVDQLILLSAAGDVAALGVFPKLFVASEGEAAADDARRMADEAPGDWNALYLAAGDASGRDIISGTGGEAALEAVLQRLEERR